MLYYLVQCYYLLYYFYILYFTGEKRVIEVDVVSAADIFISLDQGVTTSTLPNSLKLLQSVDVSNACYSVCSYEGNTYVGIYGGVARVDGNYNVTQSFVTVSGTVFGLTAYKDQLYSLVYAGRNIWKVEVYDFSGNQVTSWSHGDSSGHSNELVIVDDQVVVLDRPSKRLTIYSLTGEVIKHVPCSLLCNHRHMAICAADRHCVAVSHYYSSQVFKLDLTTEKVIWTCKDVTYPQGVTCYRSKYILVTNLNSKTTIWILDVETG